MGNPETCPHPARLRDGSGGMRCLTCGAKIAPMAAREPPEERVTSASGRRIGFDAEKPKRKPVKATRASSVAADGAPPFPEGKT